MSAIERACRPLLLAAALTGLAGGMNLYGGEPSSGEVTGATADSDSSWDPFGTPDEGGSDRGLTIGGELEYAALQFLGSAESAESLGESQTLPNARGSLSFDARGSEVDGFLKLALSPDILSADPSRVLDEAWVRLWLGQSMLEGGVMKLAWGRADSLSVLDVVNPRDLSDLTVSDPKDQKISRPMLHAKVPVGSASLEGVWLPQFAGNRIAWDGPWAPEQVRELKETGYSLLYGKLYEGYYGSAWSGAYAQAQAQIYQAAYAAYLAAHPGDTPGAVEAGLAAANPAAAAAAADSAVAPLVPSLQAKAASDAEAALPDLVTYPEGDTLEWSQFGARLTGTAGQADLGLQYFWGYLPNPVIDPSPVLSGAASSAEVRYNRYHQAGADLAAVILGLNTRFEAGVTLTDDLSGDDPLVQNGEVLWAAGFDRDLIAGINLNVQAKGSYVLAYDRIDRDAGSLDVQAGADPSASVAALRLGQKLARDTVEWELAGVWEPEKGDFALAPSLTLYRGEAELSFRGRWFGGSSSGDLGQYADQSYAQVSLRYQF